MPCGFLKKNRIISIGSLSYKNLICKNCTCEIIFTTNISHKTEFVLDKKVWFMTKTSGGGRNVCSSKFSFLLYI